MEPRLDLARAGKAGEAAMRAMMGLETAVRASGIEETILDLVKVRASQINGCAYCIDMHTKDAQLHGEIEQRLYELNAWRETPFYTDRERAALLWTEELTRISENHVPDYVYGEVHKHFNDEELVYLTLAVIQINGWNRIAIPFRAVPGTYEPAKAQHAVHKA